MLCHAICNEIGIVLEYKSNGCILIKVLCEQTRELTDDLHNFLDYV